MACGTRAARIAVTSCDDVELWRTSVAHDDISIAWRRNKIVGEREAEEKHGDDTRIDRAALV